MANAEAPLDFQQRRYEPVEDIITPETVRDDPEPLKEEPPYTPALLRLALLHVPPGMATNES